MASERKKLEKRLDDVTRLLIKQMSNYSCERCARQFPAGQRQGLDWSHYMGRAKRGTRWDLWNTFAHCTGCHRYLSSQPAYFRDWVIQTIGAHQHNLVMMRAARSTKWTYADMEMLIQHHQRLMAEIQPGPDWRNRAQAN